MDTHLSVTGPTESVTMVAGPVAACTLPVVDLHGLWDRVKVLEQSQSDSHLRSRVLELEASERKLLLQISQLTASIQLPQEPSMLHQRLDQRLHMLREEVHAMSQEKERGERVWRDRLQRCQNQLRSKEDEMTRQSQYFQNYKAQLQQKLTLARDREQNLQNRVYVLEKQLLDMTVSAATNMASVTVSSLTAGLRTEPVRQPCPRGEGEGEEEGELERKRRKEEEERRQLQQRLIGIKGKRDGRITGKREKGDEEEEEDEVEDGEKEESVGEIRLRGFIFSLQEDLRALLEREEHGVAEQRQRAEQLQEAQENSHFLSCKVEEMKAEAQRVRLSESSLAEEVEQLREENHNLHRSVRETSSRLSPRRSLATGLMEMNSGPLSPSSSPGLSSQSVGQPESCHNVAEVSLTVDPQTDQSPLRAPLRVDHQSAAESTVNHHTTEQTTTTHHNKQSQPLPIADMLSPLHCCNSDPNPSPVTRPLATERVEVGSVRLGKWCSGGCLKLDEKPSEESDALREAYRSLGLGKDLDVLQEQRDQVEASLTDTQVQLKRLAQANACLRLQLRETEQEEGEEVHVEINGMERNGLVQNHASTQEDMDEQSPCPPPQNRSTGTPRSSDNLTRALNQENRALANRIQELLQHIELQEGERRVELAQLQQHVAGLQREVVRLEQENQEQGGLVAELTGKTEDDLNTIMDLQSRLAEGARYVTPPKSCLERVDRAVQTTACEPGGCSVAVSQGDAQRDSETNGETSSVAAALVGRQTPPGPLTSSPDSLREEQGLLRCLAALREDQREVTLCVRTKTEEKQQLTRAAWALKEERDRLCQSLSSLKPERDQLARAVCGFRAEKEHFVRSMSGLKEERKQLSASVLSLQDEKEKLSASLCKDKEEVDQTVQSLRGLRQERGQLEPSVCGLKQERDQLEGFLQGLRQQRESVEAKGKRETLIHSLTEEKDKLTVSLNSLREERDELEARVVHLLNQSQSNDRIQRQDPATESHVGMGMRGGGVTAGAAANVSQRCHGTPLLHQEVHQQISEQGALGEEQGALMREVEAVGADLMKTQAELEKSQAEAKRLLSDLAQSEDRREEAERRATHSANEVLHMGEVTMEIEATGKENDRLVAEVKEIKAKLSGILRTKADLLSVKRQLEEQLKGQQAQLTAKTVALEELTSEYRALRGEDRSREESAAMFTSIRVRYDDIRAKYDVLLRKQSQTDLDVAPLKAKLSCLVLKCQARNSLLAQMTRALRRSGCLDLPLSQEAERLLRDPALQDYTQAFLPAPPPPPPLPHSTRSAFTAGAGALQRGLTTSASATQHLSRAEFACTPTPPSDNANLFVTPPIAVLPGEAQYLTRPTPVDLDVIERTSPDDSFAQQLPFLDSALAQVSDVPEKRGPYHVVWKGVSSEKNSAALKQAPPSPDPCCRRRLSSPEKIILLHQQLQNTLSNQKQAPTDRTEAQETEYQARGRGSGRQSPRKVLFYPATGAPRVPSPTTDPDVHHRTTVPNTTTLPKAKPTATMSTPTTLFSVVSSRSATLDTPCAAPRAAPRTSLPHGNPSRTHANLPSTASLPAPLSPPLAIAKADTSTEATTSLSEISPSTSGHSAATAQARTVTASSSTASSITAGHGSQRSDGTRRSPSAPRARSPGRPSASGRAVPVRCGGSQLALSPSSSTRAGAGISKDQAASRGSSEPTPHAGKAKPPRAKPESPAGVGSVEVIRNVGQSSLLIGWQRPSLDELGCSNGTFVYGYRVYVDGEFHKSVLSSACTKCIVENVDLILPIHISVQTLGSNGLCSTKVHTVFRPPAVTVPCPGSSREGQHGSSRAVQPPPSPTSSPHGCGSTQQCVAIHSLSPQRDSPNLHSRLELPVQEHRDKAMLPGNHHHDDLRDAK